MRNYDVRLSDGTHERVTAPGERAAAMAAQQVTGLPVEEVDEVHARPAPGPASGADEQEAA